MLVLIVGGSLPYHLNPELWGRVFYKVINYNWLLYTLLSFATLLPRVRLIRKNNWRQEADLIVVCFIVIGNGLVWSAYFFASYTSYISGALSFSLLMAIGVLAVLWHQHQKDQTRNQTSTPYANKKMSEEHAEPFILDLEKMMSEKKVYLDANLTLPRLAKMLSWSAPKLSQLLNDNLQKSFTEYINAYRIEHAKTLLMGESMMKMEALAERCGFNSLSTFYSAFKKHTQLTPAKYKALQSGNTSEIMNS